MKKLKEKTGITLIALVITIIVLLILAVVTIITLTGDNGLLTKASDAKQANEEAAVLEKIKTEVAGSYNLEGKINLNELKTNLKRLNIPDEDITPTIKDEKETFPVVVKMNNYEYDILEDATVDKHVDFKTLELLYGKVVNGYTGYEATDVTEWKLLYIDEENREAIIISSNKLPNNSIPIKSSIGITYTGSSDVEKFDYGKKYNSLWLEKCQTNESQSENAQATAYMCDPDNWKQYKTGNAKYAAGGPTYEILVSSFYGKQVNELKNLANNESGSSIKNVNRIGYGGTAITQLPSEGLYNLANGYYLASPGPAGHCMRNIKSNGTIGNDSYNSTVYFGFHPIVCLPASAIEVVGEGDNAVLNYK